MEGQMNSGICGNAVGHIIKPSVVHRMRRPCALKNKKNYLPVLWQHSQKPWMTAILFTEWFHQHTTRRKVSTVYKIILERDHIHNFYYSVLLLVYFIICYCY